MNNNENNNNNNIVKPIQVNTNNTNTNYSQDNFLNRERENIVSATIQANQSINKTEAKEVNNEIKIKKNNNFVSFIFIVLGIAAAIFLSMVSIKFVKEIEVANNPTTTTTTTTKLTNLQIEMNYLLDFTKVRKYQNDSYVLILSPESYDLVSNNKFYMLLKTGDKALAGIPEYGRYEIKDNVLELIGGNIKSIKKINITESGLILDNYAMKRFDTEMKSYSFKSPNKNKILIINGTLYNEQALYITTDGTTTKYQTYSFVEDQTSIKLSDGTTFTKDGMNIINNNETYTYVN